MSQLPYFMNNNNKRRKYKAIKPLPFRKRWVVVTAALFLEISPRWRARPYIHPRIFSPHHQPLRPEPFATDEFSKMRTEPSFSHRNATTESPSSSSGALVLFQFISLGLIIAVGSAGNTLVIYAFSRYLRIRRSPYMLMFGFVSLDLIRVCLCFPIIFITVVNPLQSKYATELCQLMAFTNMFCLLGNNLSILGMAIDRYVDNKHRALYRRKCRGSVGAAMLLMVWGLAFIFSFPTAYSAHSRKYRLEAKCTFPHHYSSNNADTSGLLISLAISFTLTYLIYIRLFLFLRSRRRMCPVIYEPAVSENWGFYDPRVGMPVRNRWLAHSLSDTPIAVVSRPMFQSHFMPTNYDMALWRSKKQKDNEKLTKLCFTIHIMFSVMWLPYVIICFCLAFGKAKPSVPQWAEISATWLTYIQVTITPFAFFSLSGISKNKIRVLNGKRRFSPTLSSNSSMQQHIQYLKKIAIMTECKKYSYT